MWGVVVNSPHHPTAGKENRQTALRPNRSLNTMWPKPVDRGVRGAFGHHVRMDDYGEISITRQTGTAAVGGRGMEALRASRSFLMSQKRPFWTLS